MRQDKKIWVADNDESIRLVLEKGLTEAGFNVSTFEDGNEVMNKLDVESPNIVLTDMRMPGRDGMDLLDTFKNEYPDIPIIMMTAFSDLETTVEAFDHGAWDYLAKPFDIHTAISKIDKVISERKSVTISNKQIEEILPQNEKTVDRSEAMQDLFNAIGKLMFVLSPGQDLKESDLHEQLFVQAEKEEFNWEEILESWAEKKLSKGEDHLLNVATPIFEKTMINVALKSTSGNKSEAAKLLGWGRNTLARKIQELDI